jgi:hypothetical protein
LPPPPPPPNHLDALLDFTCYLGVVLAFGRFQDYPRSLRFLLAGCMRPRQLF